MYLDVMGHMTIVFPVYYFL